MVGVRHRTMTLVEEMEGQLPIPARPEQCARALTSALQGQAQSRPGAKTSSERYTLRPKGISCDVTSAGMDASIQLPAVPLNARTIWFVRGKVLPVVVIQHSAMI